jgi:hypothetical protein
MLDLGLEAAAAQGACDTAIRIKDRLGPELLRTGTFRAGNDAERDGFSGARGLREGLEDEVSHLVTTNRTLNRGALSRGPVLLLRPASLWA